MTAVSEFFAKNVSSIPCASKDESPLSTLPMKEFIDKVSFIFLHTNSVTMLDVSVNNIFSINLNGLRVW